jgi:hypothetical protein
LKSNQIIKPESIEEPISEIAQKQDDYEQVFIKSNFELLKYNRSNFEKEYNSLEIAEQD